MVHVSIVTWNSLPYLKFCLQSLEQQAYKDLSIVVVDNGSTDGTVAELNAWRSNLGLRFDLIKLIQNPTNRGFAAAHNQGIKWHIAHSKWPIVTTCILILNPDVILTPTYLEEAVRIMDQNPQAGGMTGQLLRYKLEGEKVITTNVVDSEGLEMMPWRAVRERNAGKLAYRIEQIANSSDHKPFAISHVPVWGISGACALYRLSALEDAKRGIEYFDEDFFCYKEDVDLAWRMKTRGWKFLYTPHAVAYHQRGIGKEKPHHTRRVRINQWSYRNHFYLLLKNEPLLDFLLHAPFILSYELAKLVYYLFVQPQTLGALYDVCLNWRYMLKKRNS